MKRDRDRKRERERERERERVRERQVEGETDRETRATVTRHWTFPRQGRTLSLTREIETFIYAERARARVTSVASGPHNVDDSTPNGLYFSTMLHTLALSLSLSLSL